MKHRIFMIGLVMLLLLGCGGAAMNSDAVAPSAIPASSDEANEVTIYLVRHGETEYNVAGLLQGWCDSPLTESGVADAKALGRGLSEIPFVRAYSSDSGRAITTATYALGTRAGSMEVIQRDDLREMHYGTLEATPNADAWNSMRYANGFTDVGGENNEDVQKRMIAALTEIAKAQEATGTGGNILVVSHGLAIQKAVSEMDHRAFDRFVRAGGSLENCCVTILIWNGESFRVKTVGSTEFRDNGRNLDDKE